MQGGIASGKSTIAKMMAARGAVLLDCDKLGHEVLDSPQVQPQLVAAFGEGIVAAGKVDRKALADVVFNDPTALRRLEELVHPGILGRVQEAIQAAHTPQDAPRQVVIVDAAVAEKMRLEEAVDLKVFVAVSRAVRVERARVNRGWDEAELERREAAQKPLAEKEREADYVVRNDGGLAEAEEDVERFWTDVVEPRR